LEVVKSYEEVSGRTIPYEVVERREGDVAANWADVTRAESVLGWKTSRDLAEMCADSWRWQQDSR
jgi:UDP-glucose 4-epimerase